MSRLKKILNIVLASVAGALTASYLFTDNGWRVLTDWWFGMYLVFLVFFSLVLPFGRRDETTPR